MMMKQILLAKNSPLDGGVESHWDRIPINEIVMYI